MRDPNRIQTIIPELQKVWEKNPDWRLGQLICNLGRMAGYMEPFHVEDDKMLEMILELKKENEI